MKRSEWAAWRLPLILAALLAAASSVLFWYSLRWAKGEETALEEAVQALAQLMGRPMPERLDAESLSRAQAALPPTPELPQLMQAFRESADEAGITWVDFQVDQRAVNRLGAQSSGKSQGEPAAPSFVALDVTVQGTYMQVYRLFQEIQEWPRLTDVSYWDLNITPEETTANLRLNAYYLPRETEQEPSPVEAEPPGGRIDPT